MLYENILETIGKTPLVRLAKLCNPPTELYAKVESFNPLSSVKDRTALAMVEGAEERGELHSGATIIEPTSGNTGIGLACVAAQKGYRLIITMPETMSVERQRLMRALGAEVVLTSGSEGMQGSIAEAEAIAATIPNSYIPRQFENPDNPLVHYRTTAVEIWEDTNGGIDLFVAGVGTGGTLTGVARYLKEQNPAIQIMAVEPAASPMLSRRESGPHALQGIGANFIPPILDLSLIDEVISITEEEAYAASRRAATEEGLLVGISSGAALAAALRCAEDPRYSGKRIVTLCADTGERYLSTELFG